MVDLTVIMGLVQLSLKISRHKMSTHLYSLLVKLVTILS